MKSFNLTIFTVFVSAIFISGCDYFKNLKGEVDPDEVKTLEDIRRENPKGGLFGEDAFSWGGPPKTRDDSGGGIGVNSFLWRASLDTISFMPVNSADPFGGVIITDWHSPTKQPSERFKMNIYIMGRSLRADGIRVSVFRQIHDESGIWRDAEVLEGTGRGIEDAILMKARQFRNQSSVK